jgi:hypothetical protein
MIKIITAKAFSMAIDVDEQGKILNAPKGLTQFINMPLSVLEGVLKRNKFQSLIIETVEEA